ncbi:MAG TPA: cytidylate kinase-like family protein [Thermodesulfovibrionales bacterium]|nr:cytidylate kinase-like family protein [Thermodesulfovibrionales bacterium]
MSLITISRGSYTRGKEVAEKVAGRLGYECVARETVVEASKEFNIPEIKLIRALHDAPSILDRFSYGQEKFIAYYQLAFLEHMQRDGVVYHGLAGHFLLKGISHVLKVRIISDMKDRIKLEMERERISEREAARILKNDDEERRKWSLNVYGVDTNDSSLYDLLIHIRKITVDEAANIICDTVKFDHFKTTKESKDAFEDLLLAARVKVALIDQAPAAEVYARSGVVQIKTIAPDYKEEELIEKLELTAKAVPGVRDARVFVVPIVPFGN